MTLVLLGVSLPGFANDQAISIAAAPLSLAALEETSLDLALGYETRYASSFSFVYEYGLLQSSSPGTQWGDTTALSTVHMHKFFWGGRQRFEGGLVIWGGVSAFQADGYFDLRNSPYPSFHSRRFKARGLFAESGVGHQWDIHENLRFGIDWLAFAWPLTSTTKVSKTDTPASDVPKYTRVIADHEMIQNIDNAILELTLVRALRISVGYAF